MADWFSRLTGFPENPTEQIYEKLAIDGNKIVNKESGKSLTCGHLQIPSLRELRFEVNARFADHSQGAGRLTVTEVVGDAQQLHTELDNANSVFQVASQFNLLEMISPDVTPEQGITRYEHDRTQGPACAVACGAGTIYRNYFVEVDGKIGQTSSRQIDCLADIGKFLGNTQASLWRMQNGYALPTRQGLSLVDKRIRSMPPSERDELRSKLQIGVQWDSQVTLGQCDHSVTQVYCSALPVAYTRLPPSLWESFARLILEAAYEATFAAAALNAHKSRNKNNENGTRNRLHLTLLGGGAFGNDPKWILDAIGRACLLYAHHHLDVRIVSFGKSNPVVEKFASQIQSQVDSLISEPEEVRAPNRRQQAGTTGAPAPKTAARPLPNHFCPGCGAAQRAFLRYPWYFCQECLRLAKDGQGRVLEFGNMSFSGGLYCKYADETDIAYENCGSVLCAIHGRPVIVMEARFGGVVAQPLETENPRDRFYNTLDLLNPQRLSRD